MRRLKILELLGSGSIGTGDGASASTVVTKLANELARLGHEVTVADVKTAAARDYLDARVRLVETSVPSPLRPRRPTGPARLIGKFLPRRCVQIVAYNASIAAEMLDHRRYVQAVAAAVRLNAFDIVHVHHGKQAYFLHKLYRSPYVYTNHWAFRPDDAGFHANVERTVMEQAMVAVGLGQYVRDFAPGATLKVIPNGIDCDEWTPVDQPLARAALGLDENAFVLAFVGVVAPFKGVDVLVEAVRRLAPVLRGLRVYVVGSHSAAPGFAQETVGRARGLPITFTGPVPHRSERHRTLLGAADLFVLPSRTEAHPLATLEALAMGTPVVASEVGGLREMIIPDVGRLVAPGDAVALADAIWRLVKDRNTLRSMREKCRAYVEQVYAWKVIARRYSAMFEEVLARQRDVSGIPALSP